MCHGFGLDFISFDKYRNAHYNIDMAEDSGWILAKDIIARRRQAIKLIISSTPYEKATMRFMVARILQMRCPLICLRQRHKNWEYEIS